MNLSSSDEPTTLAVALGANISSPVGPPNSTMVAVRPQLQAVISEWVEDNLKEQLSQEGIKTNLNWRWSPLYETEPIGGPRNQPSFLNAVLVVDGKELSQIKPSEKAAYDLLGRFLSLEKQFGRNRKKSKQRWGPRSLDLDLLAWGSLQVKEEDLTLPHPRLIERSFVIVPLAAALSQDATLPRRIPPQPKWIE